MIRNVNCLQMQAHKMKFCSIALLPTLVAFVHCDFWEPGPCPPTPPVVTPFDVERVRECTPCSNVLQDPFVPSCAVRGRLVPDVGDARGLCRRGQRVHPRPVRLLRAGPQQRQRVQHRRRRGRVRQ